VRELPLQLQAALLRFLDDGLVRQVGGTATRQIDVQLLAATNAELDAEVAARRFRADLLYRLDTIRVELPPLRRRRDFAAAVRSVLRVVDGAASIDDAAIERLSRHAWPGNFRELRSVLTRALLLEPGRRLRLTDVEPLLPAAEPAPASGLQQLAADAVRREFERTGRSVSQTSRNLGVSRTTVYRHLGSGRA
jgi:sigma-54 dependent transcriptional regulator, acetoin dehydrogenase operon transcriptional activator AcoR